MLKIQKKQTKITNNTKNQENQNVVRIKKCQHPEDSDVKIDKDLKKPS